MLSMDSVQKWEKAVSRALEHNLPHLLSRRGNQVVVPSKSQQGKVYLVRLIDGKVGECECLAGQHARPCAHKAAVIIRLLERSIGARIASMEPEGVARFDEYLHGHGAKALHTAQRKEVRYERRADPLDGYIA